MEGWRCALLPVLGCLFGLFDVKLHHNDVNQVSDIFQRTVWRKMWLSRSISTADFSEKHVLQTESGDEDEATQEAMMGEREMNFTNNKIVDMWRPILLP